MRKLLLCVALACGTPPTPDAGSCGPATCRDGCCKNNVCQSGTDHFACGKAGLGCVDCGTMARMCTTSQVCSDGSGGSGGGAGGSAGGGDAGSDVIGELTYLTSSACTEMPRVCVVALSMRSERFDSLRGAYGGCTVATPATRRWTIDCRSAVTCGSSAIDCNGDAGRQWVCPETVNTANDGGCDWFPP